jgi:hypothetical protein
MINETTHTITDFSIYTSGNAEPEGITVGADGNIWFVDNAANAIGRINPTTDLVTTYTTGLSSSAGLNQITPGPDGNLWFTETSAGQIGTINPNTVPSKNTPAFMELGLLWESPRGTTAFSTSARPTALASDPSRRPGPPARSTFPTPPRAIPARSSLVAMGIFTFSRITAIKSDRSTRPRIKPWNSPHPRTSTIPTNSHLTRLMGQSGSPNKVITAPRSSASSIRRRT